MVKETRNIRRQVLPNGLTVITEQMPHIRSVAIGIWLKSGSRDEDSEWNGISHFIEHMVFKGTETRSAEAIARQVDSIGGNMDAFTAKEFICFNITVPDDDFCPHQPAQQEIARAGPDLHRRPFTPDGPRTTLRFLHPEYPARRRHELAPVPEHPRAPGARLFHLQRPESLSRHWFHVRICGHVARVGH